MSKTLNKAQLSKWIFGSLITALTTSCTGQAPGSFRFLQQEEDFSSQQRINTKIDLLWVVDNSASMDVAQSKLRSGFESFALKYLQPSWDIRVAVITTDTYMANTAFGGYLTRVIPGTVGWTSPYVSGRLASFVNPESNPDLVNLTTGAFTNGVMFGDLVPPWGSNFSLLKSGYHDGPITAFCFEGMPYFMDSVTQCQVRDAQGANTGTDACIDPDTGDGEDSLSQCVNTTQNDTVRTDRPIINTLPTGDDADGDMTEWTEQLVKDFMINISTGSAGQGSERGLGSVLQLISDNEITDSAFFREDSLRGIIFVSDEEDQTMELPESPESTFSPQSNYACDQSSLVALNGSAGITGAGGYCCSESANGCLYGSSGTSCTPKTVDGYTYTISVCADETKLIPVEDVKEQLDTFFSSLDGGDGADPNYFVTSIVPLTAEAIQSLQQARSDSDAAVGAISTVAVDRGDRYLELGNLVGNGSMELNIAEEDYTPVLEAIGRAIVEKKSTFTLNRAPTSEEDMIVSVKHKDGSTTTVKSSYYVIEGKSLVFTNTDFILSLKATDVMSINYQPKTAY